MSWIDGLEEQSNQNGNGGIQPVIHLITDLSVILRLKKYNDFKGMITQIDMNPLRQGRIVFNYNRTDYQDILLSYAYTWNNNNSEYISEIHCQREDRHMLDIASTQSGFLYPVYSYMYFPPVSNYDMDICNRAIPHIVECMLGSYYLTPPLSHDKMNTSTNEGVKAHE